MPRASTEPNPSAEPADAAHAAISVNAARVLDTTRRAWESAAHANAQSESAAKQPVSKKRVKPRRSQWGNLVAALHYWSPRPL